MISKQANPEFLVDVNLPKRFQFFNSHKFLHIADVNPSMPDSEIWNYALSHKLIILTKDTDFYNLFLIHDSCPKIVYFKIGNMTLKEMHQYFNKFWNQIISKLKTTSFLIAYRDCITAIQ